MCWTDLGSGCRGLQRLQEQEDKETQRNIPHFPTSNKSTLNFKRGIMQLSNFLVRVGYEYLTGLSSVGSLLVFFTEYLWDSVGLPVSSC